MIIKTVATAVIITGMLAPAAFKGHFHHGSPIKLMESKLKLTTAQKNAIHQIFEQHRPALTAKTGALVQARNAALDAGLDPSVSPEAWRPYQEKFAQAAHELGLEIRSAYLEALPILSDSQKTEGRALLKQFHGQVARMHGQHHEMAHHLVKNRLDLSETQDSSIQAIVATHQPALKAKAETLHQLHGSAMEAALNPATPQEVLERNFLAVRDAAFELSSEVRGTYLEAQAQLTPEQREKGKALVQDFRGAVDGIRKLLLGF